MARRRRLPPPRAKTPLHMQVQLFSYALSRLPPRQLPILGLYAYSLMYASSHGWIDTQRWGRVGSAIVAVLSMVTGLLVSYRFSSAMSKFDEGKKVWVGLRTHVREAIRMLSIAPAAPIPSSPVSPDSPNKTVSEASASTVDLAEDLAADDAQGQGTPRHQVSSGTAPMDTVEERLDELRALFVAFPFALLHHLHGSRPLPQAPLCDLLPPAYLTSLKRTEARVRFAEKHLESAAQGHDDTSNTGPSPTKSGSGESSSVLRPGLRRRGTGPKPSEKDRDLGVSEEEWELGTLRAKAEEAVARLSEAVAASGVTSGSEGDRELDMQLSQLNIPGTSTGASSASIPSASPQSPIQSGKQSGKPQSKSNLCTPHPPNLPLVLLKLLEAYICGLAEVPKEKGGWAEAKRDRGLAVMKTLAGSLGDAERLCSNPPPLPLTLHLSHLLQIYLAAIPCSILGSVGGWTMVLTSIISGWCFLGLEALASEVGGVFGSSENHHPLPLYAQEILSESLDISPAFHRYYRTRVVSRLGEDDESVLELDRRKRRGGGEDWLPTF